MVGLVKILSLPCLQLPRLVDEATLRAELHLLSLRSQADGSGRPRVNAPAAAKQQGPLVQLLFEWVAAAVGECGAAVEDFSASFADARLLCLLVSAVLSELPSFQEATNLKTL